ncbi:thiosulfate/3-mercaptopyruvate sulfurtransferase [Nocardia pseudobrasiliensis]|uniref:Thiosulfate/3-mercaptopyruvate sulfurtransferase n=1 Tax=Nocardia pseudobrasiliensis TaxID=45979 RepID=A0A370I0G2_9NOCA|nr:sulfurtransferase [Nocardia pseudobrasiliensis]RDI64236.1 thiosulfate/3-mercaptopyruvate sulfurtransferase [Nocardia pseudobrasiliensis]
MTAVLISADDLRKMLSDNASRVHLLDVRWSLGDPDGPQHYLDGHIPGAVFVDLETELAAPPSPARGRHPLPELAHLQKCARSWGLRTDEPVVVYDATGGMAAARAWWLLRWAGVEDVRILDGGLPAWERSGGESARGNEPDPEPGNIVLTTGNMPTVDADGVAAWSGLLLDARAGERYRGEVEPIDPRAGHIPGALSAPTAENLTPQGTFKSPDELRARFTTLGPGPVAVYCGSGVTAAHQVAALAVAGIEASLYPGSWSQWSNDPRRPVATV